jgi:hypothetical protein
LWALSRRPQTSRNALLHAQNDADDAQCQALKRWTTRLEMPLWSSRNDDEDRSTTRHEATPTAGGRGRTRELVSAMLAQIVHRWQIVQKW